MSAQISITLGRQGSNWIPSILNPAPSIVQDFWFMTKNPIPKDNWGQREYAALLATLNSFIKIADTVKF